MANRYWVGGAGGWNGTTHWSSTSGGASGASEPTSGDAVFFDANSGGGTIVLNGNPNYCAGLDCTGFTGNFDTSSNYGVTIWGGGSLTLAAGMTASTTAFEMRGTGSVINTNGVSFRAISFNGDSNIQSNLVMSGNLVFVAGTINTNNYDISCSATYTSGSGPVTVNWGSTTLTLGGAGASSYGYISWSGSSTTMNLGTSNIKLYPPSFTSGACTIGSKGFTFYNVSIEGTGTDYVQISGNNTFNSLTVNNTSSALRFAAGSTTTFVNFDISGTAGNLATIRSITPGSAFTFSQPSGTPTGRYLSLTDCTATGGATWFAANSTNGGNNTGWTFVTGSSGGLLEFF